MWLCNPDETKNFELADFSLGKKKMGPQSFFEGILLSTGCHSVDLAPTL